MTTQDFPTLDRPASLQGQSPSIFFGDYGALSNPFADALVDGWPLTHYDVAAVAMAPAPQQWVGDLLSQQEDSIASAMTDASLALCYEQPLISQTLTGQPTQPQRGHEEEHDERLTEAASPSTRRRSKATAPAEAGANKTRNRRTTKETMPSPRQGPGAPISSPPRRWRRPSRRLLRRRLRRPTRWPRGPGRSRRLGKAKQKTGSSTIATRRAAGSRWGRRGR